MLVGGVVGVGVVVVVGVCVCIGSWLVVGAWVVIGSCGSCVGVGSLDVGSWLGMASLGSSSLGIGEVSWLGVGSSLGVGVGVASTSCVAWLSLGSSIVLGSSWLDVLAHEARANAIVPTIDKAGILLIVFCLIGAYSPFI